MPKVVHSTLPFFVHCKFANYKYTNHLKSKYPAELLEYYKAANEIQAEQTGRNVYASLVNCLKQMAKLKGGLPAAKALNESLLDKYKKSPRNERGVWKIELGLV